MEQDVRACRPTTPTVGIDIDGFIPGGPKDGPWRFRDALGVFEMAWILHRDSLAVRRQRWQISARNQVGDDLGDITGS